MGFKSMQVREIDNWKITMMLSVIIGAFMLIAMGLAGYFAFRSETDGEILNNFSGPVADFFKLLIVVHLILYIPIDFIILR